MLDALLAEARLRWGLDPADGLAVVAAERLIAVPVEPSLPLVILPAARLAAGWPGADGDVPAASEPLPGRHGPRGSDPLEVLRRLYPADHAVGRFGRPEATTVSELAAEDLAGALYLGPVAPVADTA